jgi:hypothetical protein
MKRENKSKKSGKIWTESLTSVSKEYIIPDDSNTVHISVMFPKSSKKIPKNNNIHLSK